MDETNVHNDENDAVAPMPETPTADLSEEEKDKRKRAAAVIRTRRWRQNHPDYSRNHRSAKAKARDAEETHDFWSELESLRRWDAALLGPHFAEWRYFSSVMAVILVEAAKFADGKSNVLTEADFIFVALELEAFEWSRLWLRDVAAEARSKKQFQYVPPRGVRDLSEWTSLLMKPGHLHSQYLETIRTKLNALGYSFSPEVLREEIRDVCQMSLVVFLLDPANNAPDGAKILEKHAKKCVYKSVFEPASDYAEELSKRELEHVLRVMGMVTPAVISTLQHQFPIIANSLGVPLNKTLVETGAPAFIEAALWDMRPADYRELQRGWSRFAAKMNEPEFAAKITKLFEAPAA